MGIRNRGAKGEGAGQHTRLAFGLPGWLARGNAVTYAIAFARLNLQLVQLPTQE